MDIYRTPYANGHVGLLLIHDKAMFSHIFHSNQAFGEWRERFVPGEGVSTLRCLAEEKGYRTAVKAERPLTGDQWADILDSFRAPAPAKPARKPAGKRDAIDQLPVDVASFYHGKGKAGQIYASRTEGGTLTVVFSGGEGDDLWRRANKNAPWKRVSPC